MAPLLTSTGFISKSNKKIPLRCNPISLYFTEHFHLPPAVLVYGLKFRITRLNLRLYTKSDLKGLNILQCCYSYSITCNCVNECYLA